MKQCVVHTTKCTVPTTVASARVARYLSEKLKCPLHDGWVDYSGYTQYDRIFYVNSMGAFAEDDFRKWLAEQVRHCKELVYVQQDYSIHPISQTQKVMRDERDWSHDFPFYRGPVLWTTVYDFMVKDADSYVNWNCLTYDPLPLPEYSTRLAGLAYWGSFRQDRADRFAEYLYTDKYPVHMLCIGGVYKKFQKHSLETIDVNRLIKGKQWKHLSSLAAYDATVYIQDHRQDSRYDSLANRFYEAMSAGLAIFVDQAAVNTFMRAGLKVHHDWIVCSQDQVAEKLPFARDIARDQRDAWAKDFKKVLDAQVERAYDKLMFIR